MLGVLTTYIHILGGARAFTDWATTKVKSRFQAQLLPIFMGMFIFFDDAFSSLVAGNVSRPLTDKYRVSRAKLSYLVDSTAAPDIILVPISGWAAFITTVMAGILADLNIDDFSGYEAFLRSVPTNFYAITALIFVFVVAYFGLNFGPMRRHEERAVESGEVVDASGGHVPGEPGAELTPRRDGVLGDLLWPVLTLIGATILLALWLGITRTAGSITAIKILTNTDVIFSLAAAVVIATVVALTRALRKGTTSALLSEGFLAGVQSMLPAAGVLFLAWMTAETLGELGVGEYLGGLIAGTVLLALLPAIFFLLSAFISFSIGSTFGTFGVMLPHRGRDRCRERRPGAVDPCIRSRARRFHLRGPHVAAVGHNHSVGHRIGDQSHRPYDHAAAVCAGVCGVLDRGLPRPRRHGKHRRGAAYRACRTRRLLLLLEREVRGQGTA